MKKFILLCLLKSEDNVEPLPDEQKVTERSEDYIIIPKAELHRKIAPQWLGY